jgi:hypothetical protein
MEPDFESEGANGWRGAIRPTCPDGQREEHTQVRDSELYGAEYESIAGMSSILEHSEVWK